VLHDLRLDRAIIAAAGEADECFPQCSWARFGERLFAPLSDRLVLNRGPRRESDEAVFMIEMRPRNRDRFLVSRAVVCFEFAP
jgi:hypothetical protein